MNMKHWLSIVLLISSLNCNLCDKRLERLVSDPDENRTPCEMIESRNFKCDTHWAKTADGYIIAIHRVINPILKAAKKPTIRPVVVQHGLIGSTLHWVIGRNLPYLLANYGYDVWMPNSRGNQFSQNHTFLDPEKDSDFWKFSFDEMIIYDSPAVIDYILRKTGYKKLDWIGVSQGAMIMFGLLAEKPEYSAKINLFYGLAPAVFLGNMASQLKSIAKVPGLLKIATLIKAEFAIPRSVLDPVVDQFCGELGGRNICQSVFEFLIGKNPNALNSSRLLVYIKQGINPTSFWNLVHYGSSAATGKFAKFDYGWLENLARYGSINPPEYKLSAINLKNIVIMSSDNDILVSPKDVQILKKAVKVPIIEYRVKDKNFTHGDFCIASNVYEMVNVHIVRHLRQSS
uniref:Lipase n=1 Tax=Tetranychus urticae TaxID=32264 RepID=T1KA80_TETUR